MLSYDERVLRRSALVNHASKRQMIHDLRSPYPEDPSGPLMTQKRITQFRSNALEIVKYQVLNHRAVQISILRAAKCQARVLQRLS